MAATTRVLPPGVTAPVVVLRSLLLVLPCTALALALPEVPHWSVVLLVVVSSAQWTRSPDDAAGAAALVLVAGWWAVHGVVDWRIPVVGVLLAAAHLAATVAAYGPATLPLDRHLLTLWLRRGLLALVPMPVAYLAVRGLDPRLAPDWVWMSAGMVVVVLLVVASRLTQAEPE